MKKWILLLVLLLGVTDIAQAIPDPSAWYCTLQGYEYEIRTDEQGNQYGVCVFPDGSECSAWAYYCKCEPDGIGCWPGDFSCHWPCKEMRCKEAGEPVLVSKCCEGLDELYPPHIFDANCNKLELVGWLFLCSDCGNGICECWESKCNCPEDCAEPRIIYVDADASGANDGSSWTNAYNYLQDALAVSSSGDEVRVAEGIYKPDQGANQTPGDRTATFQLINGVAIRGGYAGSGEPDPNARDIDTYESILSGDLDSNDVEVNDPCDLWNEPSRAENCYHVVTASGTDETAVFDSFTITGGNADGSWRNHQGDGGGMYNREGSPTVTNCTFIRNSAGTGGGMYNVDESSPTLTNCAFNGNYGDWNGGGMYNDSGSPTLTNCAFGGNSAGGFGGGMFNWDSSPTLSNCTFIGNSAQGLGGGMSNYTGSEPTLTNCTFSDNSAKGGGGIDNSFGSNSILTNCTFSGNSADNHGGGMCNLFYSSPMLTNCTFRDNSASAHGGGIWNWRGSNPMLASCLFSGNSASSGGGMGNYDNTGATLTNCTFAGNLATDGRALACDSDEQDYPSSVHITNCIFWDGGDEIWNNDGSAIIISYSDVEGGEMGIYDPCEGLVWGDGNIDDDPCFADANNGDYHLLEGSPCIDAGDPNYIAEPNETDLDGKPRVIGGRIDMGVYEYGQLVPAEVRIVPRTISLESRGKWITAFLWLPEGYAVTDIADIDSHRLLLDYEIEPERFQVNEEKQVVMAMFSRSEVQGILNVGEFELSISLQLMDGTVFEGRDLIRVTSKSGGKPDKYVQASNPNPADGATGVDINVDLSWTTGSDVTSHDVYFGTTSPGTFRGNQTATTFDPGTMAGGATYYWRIDEVNAGGTTTGTVWSFTTGGGPGPR